MLSNPPGISMYFYQRFAGGGTEPGDEWYRFEAIDDIPPCALYTFPFQTLNFKVPPLCHGDELVTIHLQDALDTLAHDERLNLNPARWSRVKRDLSQGWCYTPFMGFEDGSPLLTNGRHRVVAMMKFLGMEYATFSVPPENVDAVSARLRVR